jgi:hypothetical protein
MAGQDSVEGTRLVRRALASVDPQRILERIDELNLQPAGNADVVILAPLRNLRRGRNVVAFVTTGPAPAIRFVAEMCSHETLERVVAVLGDAADNPTFEQLAGAVDDLLAEGCNASDVTVMLALAAANQVPAAGHCRRLLDERAEFSLPELDAPPPPPVSALHEVDPQIKEQRRQRRELQRQSKRRAQSRPPTRPARTPNPPVAPGAVARPEVAAVATTRRRAPLTPIELAEFSDEDARSGDVLWVRIEHEGSDWQSPGVHEKERPAVLVAANDDAVLVRPVYSRESPERVLLAGWVRLGLDRPSWVGAERWRVERREAGSLRHIGRLSDEEWNSLL